MGSQQSLNQNNSTNKNNNNNNIKITTNIEDKKINKNRDKDYSSYKGIKSDNDKGVSSEDDMIEDPYTNKNINNSNQNNQIVEIIFYWKEGGNDVFITGSFALWKQYFMLERQGDIFYRKINLNNEKHYFKFIVDKEWKVSSYYDKVYDDKGNISNVIDLSNMNKSNQNSKNEQSNKNLKSQKIVETDPNSYNEIYPERSVLNSETPLIPTAYSTKFNLNNTSFQKRLGQPKFINLNYQEHYNNSNNSTSEISLPSHLNM